MGENTNIAWTDNTFNPWIGCSKVHLGCKNCYAETLMDMRYGKVQWGSNGTRMLTSPANWKKPLKWNAEAEKSGVRTKVFCASLADIFEDWSGPVLSHSGEELRVFDEHSAAGHSDGDDQFGPIDIARESSPFHRRANLNHVRAALFKLIDQTPNLDWQLLTKRPENILKMWPARADYVYVPEAGEMNEYPMHRRDNVWIGTSVSNQETAETQIPELLKCRDLSPVMFLSAEPLLDKIDLREWLASEDGFVANSENGPKHVLDGASAIDWVIIGGESGHGSRRLEANWSRWIVQQCAINKTPCFNKQMGTFVVDRNDSFGYEKNDWNLDNTEAEHDINGFRENYQGADCRIMLRDKKGGDISEWPEDLRVRQFPFQ